MATEKIAIRSDTAANWTSANPTLDAGEQGYETDTGRRKIGDGATAWNSLGYRDFGLNASGNIVVPAGKGLDFSASESGGASSSVLDDYEEGTFTATFDTGTFTGTYRKIGSLCFFHVRIDGGAFSGGSVGGLPFTSIINADYQPVTFGRSKFVDFFDGDRQCRAYIDSNSTTIVFRTAPVSGDDASFTVTTSGPSGDFSVSGTYITS